ncbi:GAF domain-containing protein [Vallicoccus soli]|uniref:GAF domain-containing protein n=1 Tax=Vallicoccus soli TaxID=2339232 RepID=A0A3A3Z0B2_9ACTN|nr:GAF domain-containing protein [Vallicoccus soli]RJK97690.1 GAF domain-containing protein [Vallicoccus soli]
MTVDESAPTPRAAGRTPLPRHGATGLSAPTGDDVRQALRRLPGCDAEAVWDRVCDRARVPRGAYLLELEELDRLAAALLQEPGEVGLAGRALAVRAGTYRALAGRGDSALRRRVDWGREALELLLRSRLQDVERLRAVARLDPFRAEVRDRLDRVCRDTAVQFGQDAGAVTFVLDGAQAVAGSHGVGGWVLESGGLPVEWSFCATTVRTRRPYVVEDATEDVLQRTHPLVVGPEGLRSYAGAPLITAAGHVLGALCVVGGAARAVSAQEVAELQSRAAALAADLERTAPAAAA